jgi:hypothetical protein
VALHPRALVVELVAGEHLDFPAEAPQVARYLSVEGRLGAAVVVEEVQLSLSSTIALRSGSGKPAGRIFLSHA